MQGTLKILSKWAWEDVWQSTEDGKMWFDDKLVILFSIYPRSGGGDVRDDNGVGTA